jgi:hypothetical protein
MFVLSSWRDHWLWQGECKFASQCHQYTTRVEKGGTHCHTYLNTASAKKPETLCIIVIFLDYLIVDFLKVVLVSTHGLLLPDCALQAFLYPVGGVGKFCLLPNEPDHLIHPI